MYERLANYVIGLPPDQIAALYLEDVAICAAWYESHEDDQEIQEQYAGLRQAFDEWVKHVEAPRTDTMGYRQQPLVRKLIKELSGGDIARLQRDELDLLYFAAGLARRSGKLHIFRRVLSCLAPFMREIEQARRKKPLEPGCPALGRRLAVITEDDLRAAEARDVRTFGGLSVPIRGPVYMREGDIRVMTDVPTGCTVVVDQGSCHVRGSVLGNVAATVGCEILDNIGGVVVARRGSVCAKDIVNQAIVVSKEASVRAKSAQSPKMIFASREIEIAGDVVQGRCLARKLLVEGKYEGGDIFATEWAEARNFISSDNRRLRICLVRGLSCQDYGEVLSLEAGKLHNSAMKLRQRLTSLEELIEMTEREADDFAGNVLLYILGEGDAQDRIQEIQRLRRRQSVLERLIAGGRAIMAAAEDRINLMSTMKQEFVDAASSSNEEQATLDDLRRELAMLATEGSIDPELEKDKEEILYLGRKLQRKGLEPQGVEQVLTRLVEKCGELEEKNKELRGVISREENAIEKTVVRAALIERAKAECSRVEMLKQLLAAARKRPNMDVFRQRSNDRYVRLLQRVMENRLSRMAGYLVAAKEVQLRIEQLREKLWNEYTVSLPDHVLRGWAVGGARIRGCFSPGVLICAWRHLLDDDAGTPRGRILTDSDAENMRKTYVRTEQSTIELAGPPEPHETDDSGDEIRV